MADNMRIKSLDELRDAQAAASAQGGSIPNYNDWNNILADFEEQGIKSTGSYEGDMALRNEMQRKKRQNKKTKKSERLKTLLN